MPILSWLTREEDIRAAGRVAYRLLEEVPELGAGDPDTGNMLIQGDNLEALKSLLPFYAGQVKCIYIDPPYNTGSAFEHYDDALEHSKWLAMMWPRLELLRDLLSEDGSIWVSIDDREGHYLKVLMDEVFGRKNFLANIVWQKKYAGKADSGHLTDFHDHIMLFAKNSSEVKIAGLPRTQAQDDRYKNPDFDPRGVWQSDNLLRTEERDYAIFPIVAPNGKEHWPPKGSSWRYNRDKIAELIADNRISFGPSGTNVPRLKRFLTDVAQAIPAPTWWPHTDVGHNSEAKKETMALLDADDQIFATPKPERLVQRIVQLASAAGDIVLDSFVGSGTTAAVAQKMGRRFIVVEMGNHAVSHAAPRMRKVIEGEQGGISEAVSWGGGGGFRFFRLGATIFDQDGQIRSDIRFDPLAAHIWFSETETPMKRRRKRLPFLGVHKDVGYALLYNGILGDKRPQGGNVLTRTTLDDIREAAGGFDGPMVIYGERAAFGAASLARERITFKQTPYDVKARR